MLGMLRAVLSNQVFHLETKRTSTLNAYFDYGNYIDLFLNNTSN